MARAGIFGGSFDPIHTAHLELAQCALDQRRLDGVIFVPARVPPHKVGRPLAPAGDRLRMIELAVRDRPAFRVSTVELDRDGPSYTLLTVRELRRELGATAELFLLLGADSVRDLPTWWRADELVREAAVVPFGRPGCRLQEDLARLAERFGAEWAQAVAKRTVEAPLMDVSSTAIRERVGSGRSIEGLVPEAVARYIASHGLYARG